MCEGKFASHSARQEKSREIAERTKVLDVQGAAYRLAGTSLWVSRERDGVMAVWVEVGSRILRRCVIVEERAC